MAGLGATEKGQTREDRRRERAGDEAEEGEGGKGEGDQAQEGEKGDKRHCQRD